MNTNLFPIQIKELNISPAAMRKDREIDKKEVEIERERERWCVCACVCVMYASLMVKSGLVARKNKDDRYAHLLLITTAASLRFPLNAISPAVVLRCKRKSAPARVRTSKS